MAFPENEIAVFQDYLPDPLGDAVLATGAELSRTIAPLIRDPQDFAFPSQYDYYAPLTSDETARQVRAQQVDTARRGLLAALAPLLGGQPDAVTVVKRVNEDVVRHELEAALTTLAAAPQDGGLPPGAPAPDLGMASLAFTEESITFATLVLEEYPDPLDPRTTVEIATRGDEVLPGFSAWARLSADDIAHLVELFAFVADAFERTFRVGIMRAGLHTAAARPADGLAEHLALLARPELGDTRRKAVAIQASFAGLALGDALFRRVTTRDDERRADAAREYAAAVARLDAHGVAAENPLRVQIEQHAQMQTAKLDSGFNVLGYSDGYVPILRGDVLKAAAQLRLEEADAAVRQYVAFKSSAQEIQDRLRELDFQADVKTKELDILDGEIRNAEDQKEIAATRRDHVADQLDDLNLTLAADIGGALIGATASAFFAQGKDGHTGGTSVPGIAGAFSGAITAVAGYIGRRDDLEFQKAISDIEHRIAERDVAIAQGRREIAAATLEFMGQQVRRIQARELGADLFFAAAESFRALAERHLNAAIQWAYLYERAVIFKRLTDDEHHIRFEYASGPGGLLTAVETLREGLTAVEEADVPQTKFQLLAETFSLRSWFPLEFAQLLATGAMDFTFSLFELNKRRPGVHRQRIKQVDVKVQFPPPSGFTGRLIHNGSFMLRDRDTTLAATTFMPSDEELQAALDALGAGAAQGIPIGGVIPFVLDLDSIELSADPAGGDADPAAQALIEGYGPAANWRLEIENVDMRHISDVLLTITFLIPESDQRLAAKVKELIAAEEAQVLFPDEPPDLISPFSLRDRFPAEFAQLANGGAELVLGPDDFPAAATGRRLKTAVVQAIDADGKGVAGIGLEFSRPGTAFARAGTTGATGFSEDLTGPVSVLAPADRPDADGAYLLHIPDPSELQRLHDLLLLVVYEYGRP
jgi:hypothetical protein